MVYRRKLVNRTTFKKLPKGAHYWTVAVGTEATQPSIKTDNRDAIAGWDIAKGNAELSAAPDISLGVIRVPPQFTGQRHTFN